MDISKIVDLKGKSITIKERSFDAIPEIYSKLKSLWIDDTFIVHPFPIGVIDYFTKEGFTKIKFKVMGGWTLIIGELSFCSSDEIINVTNKLPYNLSEWIIKNYLKDIERS